MNYGALQSRSLYRAIREYLSPNAPHPLLIKGLLTEGLSKWNSSPTSIKTKNVIILFGHKIFGGSTCPGNAACWRDVVCSNRVAQIQQHVSIFNSTRRWQFLCLQHKDIFTARKVYVHRNYNCSQCKSYINKKVK